MLWSAVLCFLSIQNVFCFSNMAHLGINRVNKEAMAKKRRDTIAMCENYNHKQRYKREAPATGQKYDIDQIVKKFYDEDEYKALLNNSPTNRTRNQEPESNEQNEVELSRRLSFAPLQLDQSRTESPSHRNKVEMSWHKEWEYGIIPYYIDSESYDSMLVDIITRGFRYIEKVSCIRLLHLREPPTNVSELNWLYITNSGSIRQCVHSNDQKANAGKQIVVFGYDCLSIGEIAHEIMHVLGFGHEHNRPDRDKHVVIEWDNIKAGYRKFFEIQQANIITNFDYDYDSVLHYPSRAFTANGKVTIRTKNETKIGQRIGLSEKDVEKIHMIFGQECTRRDQNHLEKTCPKVMENKDADMEKAVKNADLDDFDETDYYEKRIWPYAIVNYGFSNPIEFTPEELEQLSDVFKYIEEETNCIEFRRVPTSEDPQARRHSENIIQFERSSSPVCKCPPIGVPSKDLEATKISAGCFNSINELLHFMCHILGFDHQHNTFDRDNYLSIIWDRVSGEAMSDLQRVLPKEASLGFRYDYHSIMHYPWLQVSNGKKTIMYPVWNDGWAMGHWQGLSEIDILKLKKVYKKHCEGFNGEVGVNVGLSDIDKVKLKLYLASQCGYRQVDQIYKTCMSLKIPSEK